MTLPFALNLTAEQLSKLSDAEAGEMLAALEALHREKCKSDIVEYASYIEVPGTPSPTSPNDRIRLLRKKAEMRKRQNRREGEGLWEDPEDIELEEPDVPEAEFYPKQLEVFAHHKLILNAVQALMEEEEVEGPLTNGHVGIVPEGVMLFMPPGSAKALALDTPIPTPGGWRKMGDLQIGDRVFDERGEICSVTGVSPVWRNRPVYRVTTDCGDEIIADHDHEWLVRLCRKTRAPLKTVRKRQGRPPRADRDDPASHFKIKETWELARSRCKRPMVKRAAALVLPDVELPIDPYLLGVWLGDGACSNPVVTSGAEDQGWLRTELERLGYVTSTRSEPRNFGVLGMTSKFVALGLLNNPWIRTPHYGRKHIPAVYMRASAAQRLALLQGLIDTDGTVCKNRGSVTFCNTNRELAEQARELIRSLGVKAGWSEGPAMLNGVQHGTAYRISFYLRDAARMPRKAKLTRDQNRTPNTYIDVTPAGLADTVCIEVDSPSHLFLAGKSMTPTHNSSFGSVVAPSYVMGRWPGTDVIGVSYAGDLAKRFGRRVRHICRSDRFNEVFDCTVTGDNQAVDQWSLTNGSTYRAVGILGGVTGNRSDLLSIDDPIAGREEAESEIIRDKTNDAVKDDLLTRLKPFGKVLMTLTRWQEDDPAGHLLGEEWEGQSGLWKGTDGRWWLVLCLPLLADSADDPLGRALGERLWPEWFTERFVELAQQAGDRSWTSLYQQKPSASEGVIMLKRYWKCWPHGKPEPTEAQMEDPVRTEPPKNWTQCVLVYDTAFEDGEDNDYSAMSAWAAFGQTPKFELRRDRGQAEEQQNLILLGGWRGKVQAVDLFKIVEQHVEFYMPDHIVVEKKASGHQLVQELRRRRPRYTELGQVCYPTIHAWENPLPPGAKGKTPRGHSAAVTLEQGSVWFMPSPTALAIIKECASAPNGRYFDWFDTVTNMLIWSRTINLLEVPGDLLMKDEEETMEREQHAFENEARSSYGRSRSRPASNAARSLYGRSIRSGGGGAE